MTTDWQRDVTEIRRVTEHTGDIDLAFVAAAERLADCIEQLRDHLAAVVDYNWQSEMRDAIENGTDGHVINHLIALAEFIGQPPSDQDRALLATATIDEEPQTFLDTDWPEPLEDPDAGSGFDHTKLD